MTLTELTYKLLEIRDKYQDDPETAHGEMDDAILDYFDAQGPEGKAVAQVFESQEKWYA